MNKKLIARTGIAYGLVALILVIFLLDAYVPVFTASLDKNTGNDEKTISENQISGGQYFDQELKKGVIMSDYNNTNNSESRGKEILQFVTFTLTNELFGVDILDVQEINRMVNITRVPNLPSYVEGIINLRGRVIPVIDLRKRLDYDIKKFDKETRIIVVEIENKVLGFIVDSVNEVIRIDKSITEPPPSVDGGVSSEYITGIAKLEDRLITLLNIKKLLVQENITEEININ
jgi:purine-binding chemotaxis protein CheW